MSWERDSADHASVFHTTDRCMTSSLVLVSLEASMGRMSSQQEEEVGDDEQHRGLREVWWGRLWINGGCQWPTRG
jgi:hypothetical protein